MQTNFECSQSKQSLRDRSTGGEEEKSKTFQRQAGTVSEYLFFWILGTSYSSNSLGRKCTDQSPSRGSTVTVIPPGLQHSPTLFHCERNENLIQRSSAVNGENYFP